jgi:hypothetical protein
MNDCLSCDEDAYEAYLTEIFGSIKIGCCEFDAGRILKEMDPIAFRCGMLDEECTCEGVEKNG